MEWKSSTGRKIVLQEGDITRTPVDAMANAANSALTGGGGVDGAIHRAGGPSIMQELDVIRKKQGGCPTGSAVATGAGNLPAKWVFHAVGPVYRDGTRDEPKLLAACYRKCLELAEERGAKTISFPAISTGIYGYPQKEAASIAIQETLAHLNQQNTSLETVIFVLFGKVAFDIYATELNAQKDGLNL